MLAAMNYRPCSALLLLVWSVACGNGIGVTDASSITTSSSSDSTPGSSTGPAVTTGDPGTGGTSTTGVTGTGGATGSSGPATDTDDTAAIPTTGATTGTGTGDSTGVSSTGDGTTGGPVACVNVDADYGDCEAEIGIGFDGTTCRSFSGCDCAPNCDNFFPSMTECASTCAAAGECNEDAIDAVALAMDPVGPGSFCDEVDACAEANSALAMWLVELFPGLVCEQGFPCEGADSCHLQFQGEITARQWTDLCAASLLPGAALSCVVFGP
jgi:hypothetical protein